MGSKKVIGVSGTQPIYDNYGEGVTVKKIKETHLGAGHSVWDYEISIPLRPRWGGVRKEIKGQNAVIEYAEASAELIRKKKLRGRWT